VSGGEKAGKAAGVASAVSAVAARLRVVRDEERNEVLSVHLGPIPLFTRDEQGRPRVFGIPFRRWARGPRT
jgi:hypothetical protein